MTKKSRKPRRADLFFPLASADKYTTAKVVAAGIGTEAFGGKVEMQVKVGDTVLYPVNSGIKVKVGGEEYTLIRQSDALAVIE